MPCDTIREGQTMPQREAEVEDALKRLEEALRLGEVSVRVGPTGSVAFDRWAEADRAGLSDLCAFRKLSSRGSAALRTSIARAEAVAGRTVDKLAVASGVHSHDGGRTWHPGHKK